LNLNNLREEPKSFYLRRETISLPDLSKRINELIFLKLLIPIEIAFPKDRSQRPNADPVLLLKEDFELGVDPLNLDVESHAE
jgi:hypothetical protein